MGLYESGIGAFAFGTFNWRLPIRHNYFLFCGMFSEISRLLPFTDKIANNSARQCYAQNHKHFTKRADVTGATGTQHLHLRYFISPVGVISRNSWLMEWVAGVSSSLRQLLLTLLAYRVCVYSYLLYRPYVPPLF